VGTAKNAPTDNAALTSASTARREYDRISCDTPVRSRGFGAAAREYARYDAAFSASAVHFPSRARPFIRARCRKAF
jgi:hypothetical protein